MEDHIENQQQALQILKDNLTMAQNSMKQKVDQHRSERSFEVGDWVFLRLQPLFYLHDIAKTSCLNPHTR